RTLGILMIVIALPAALFVREPPRSAAARTGDVPVSMGSVFRRPAFYLLAIGSMCSIGSVGGTMQNLKLYLTLDRGLTQGRVATLLSLILVGSIVGRLLMGWLADRWAKKHVMLVIYAIVAGTIPLLAAAPSEPLLFTAAALFGVKVLGRLMGVVLTADGVAEAVVPMLVAGLRDRTGTYAAGFGLLAGLAVLGAVAVACLPRPRPADTVSSGSAVH